MLITRISQISKTHNSMELDITYEQLDRVNNRHLSKELIQDIVPNLSKEEREFLITGITPKEWNELFKCLANIIGNKLISYYRIEIYNHSK